MDDLNDQVSNKDDEIEMLRQKLDDLDKDK